MSFLPRIVVRDKLQQEFTTCEVRNGFQIKFGMTVRGAVSKLGGRIKLSRPTFKERQCLGFDCVDGPEVVGVGLKTSVNRRKEVRSEPGRAVGYPHNNHG